MNVRRLIQRWSDKIRQVDFNEEDGVYRAEVGSFQWYVPFRDSSQVIWCRDFLSTHERFIDQLSPGDIVVEVGAATGEYTVEAAQKIRPGGKLYAFEAEPTNAKCLRKNLELVGLSDIVEVVELALSDTAEETVEFAVADVIGDHRVDATFQGELDRDPSEYKKTTVKTTTLDQYFKQENHHISMLKLTANGHEVSVIRGGSEIIQQVDMVFANSPYVMMEGLLEDYGFDSKETREHAALGEPVLYSRE